MKAGDYVKSGKRVYKIINKNGVLGIYTKYFGFVNVLDYIQIMHNKIQIISEEDYRGGVSKA